MASRKLRLSQFTVCLLAPLSLAHADIILNTDPGNNLSTIGAVAFDADTGQPGVVEERTYLTLPVEENFSVVAGNVSADVRVALSEAALRVEADFGVDPLNNTNAFTEASADIWFSVTEPVYYAFSARLTGSASTGRLRGNTLSSMGALNVGGLFGTNQSSIVSADETLSIDADGYPAGNLTNNFSGALTGLLTPGKLYIFRPSMGLELGFEPTGPAVASAFFELSFNAEPWPDMDADNVVDLVDNCVEIANTSQRDEDDDGFGTACDADFNGDCLVNVIDLGLFRDAFFGNDRQFDLNGDFAVNATDLGLFRILFFSEPGPSGLASACPE